MAEEGKMPFWWDWGVAQPFIPETMHQAVTDIETLDIPNAPRPDDRDREAPPEDFSNTYKLLGVAIVALLLIAAYLILF